MNITALSPVVILAQGLGLSLLFTALIIVSLLLNARMWLSRYPEAVRLTVAPITAREKREGGLFSLLFVVAFIGVTVWFARQIATPGLTFDAAYLHLFLVMLTFNLFDAVVIDWFILVQWQPQFARPRGLATTAMSLNTRQQHLAAFLKGIVFCLIMALPFAWLATQ